MHLQHWGTYMERGGCTGLIVLVIIPEGLSFFKKRSLNPSLVNTPIIPALGRLKQEDCKLQASLAYIARLFHKKTG